MNGFRIQNIYAFCRYGDDLGDEAPFSNNLRWKLLDCWEIDLNEAARDDWSGNPRHPILRAVQHTAKKYSIPLEPFWKLIQAFKMDQKITRYQTWEELREYCIHSADPVGHLFLYVYGHDDAELRKISDYTCTALQLANHWQDVARDYSQNRIYVPIEDMKRFGYTMEMYQARLYNQQWKELMQFQVERTQSWFDKGSPLVARVDQRLAVDLQMFTSGGEAVLRAIEKSKYNTWKKRPTVSKFKQIMMLLKAKSMWKKINQ